jgi:hypothetical protein
VDKKIPVFSMGFIKIQNKGIGNKLTNPPAKLQGKTVPGIKPRLLRDFSFLDLSGALCLTMPFAKNQDDPVRSE